jgi:hypothetical protein
MQPFEGTGLSAMHVRAVVLPDDVERDLYVAGGCYVATAPGLAVTLRTTRRERGSESGY